MFFILLLIGSSTEASLWQFSFLTGICPRFNEATNLNIRVQLLFGFFDAGNFDRIHCSERLIGAGGIAGAAETQALTPEDYKEDELTHDR